MATTILGFGIGVEDESTAAAILQLQLDDLISFEAGFKGKGREEDVDDLAFSIELARAETQELIQTIDDRRMALSISRAVQTDRDIITTATAADAVAHADHEMAVALERGSFIPTNQDPLESHVVDNEYLAKLMGLYVSESDAMTFMEEEEIIPQAESSRAGLYLRCEACQENKKFFDVASLSCRHEYCRDCLNQLFSASMTDESLFPPRCCREPVDFQAVRLFLTLETAKTFEEKGPELRTPNRTYCFRAECSAWIPPDTFIGDVGVCPECGTRTCSICKAAAHTGDCPEDEATQQLLTLAEEIGWQRCFRCRRVVELNVGCNHMSCRCGAQFCYVCGEQWKRCECPHWREDRLFARAEQIFDRGQHQAREEPPPAAVPEALLREDANLEGDRAQAEVPFIVGGVVDERQVQIENIMQDLRLNHDCIHEQWRFVRGRHQCEECLHNLPQYIFECRQCNIRTCNRCRRNRLY